MSTRLRILASVLLPFAAFAFSQTASASLSARAPISDDGTNRASGQNAGYLIFDFESGFPWTNEVNVDASTWFPYPVSWKFWSENVGWITMGHGVSWSEPKIMATSNPSKLKLTGFAWSQNAGWIAFAPRGSVDFSNSANSDPYLDTTTSRFSGFAWSQNLGWIDMGNLYLDVVAPKLSLTGSTFAADKAKSFTIDDGAPSFQAGFSAFVEKWDSTAISAYSTKTFVHDFRKAKPYSVEVTDPSWNSSSWTLEVVAAVPSGTLDYDNVWDWATSTSVSSTSSSFRAGNGMEKHSVVTKLRDKYGNPVLSVPGIKTVKMSVALSNDVDAVQLEATALSPLGVGNFDIGDAITYDGFWLVSGIVGNSGWQSNASDGTYVLDVMSLAPTKSGYPETSDRNDVKVSDLSYEVTASNGYSWIWEASSSYLPSVFSAFKFVPAAYVSSATNSDNWNIRTGYPSTFEYSVSSNGAASVSNGKVSTVLDVTGGNSLLSFQEPAPASGGYCVGYNETLVAMQSWQYSVSGSDPTLCDRSAMGSSNAVRPFTSLPATYSDIWTPKIVVAAPKENVLSFATDVSYSVGGTPVAHPSYKKVGGAETVKNYAIKIVGQTSWKYLYGIEQGNVFNTLGETQPTSEIRNAVHKSVERLVKWWVPASAPFLFKEGQDLVLSSWPAGKDAVIVRGGDVYLSGDVPNGSSAKAVVSLFDKNTGKWGNVYVGKNVKSVFATVFADGSFMSRESDGTYLSDTQTATWQLFVKGSIVSNNTVGGASVTPLKCPYLVTQGSCSSALAKRYDLNYLRAYEGTDTASPGYNPDVPAEYAGYSAVVIYDSRLQEAPPSVFKEFDTTR